MVTGMAGFGSNGAVGSYAADYQYRTEQAKKQETDRTEKKKVSGRTIGEPVLSEKAQKYYEKLKAKYSNMEFILVSPEKKEEAERNKGMYQSAKELMVLIDSDKIEKMAEDEAYRQKYEGILSGATMQMNQMKDSLGSDADSVRSFGMTFDDHGNASFFAVIDKSLAAQRERLEEKHEQNVKEKKEAAKENTAKRAEEKKNEKVHGHDKDCVTVTASGWDELLKKIKDVLLENRTDYVRTDAEKKIGQSFDYSI